MKNRKVTIIGAGMVGSACAYTLMQTGLFHEIVIIDVDRKKAEGEALDITHGASFTKPLTIKAGCYRDSINSDIIIICAGANQKPGESRLDLMDRNLQIFRDIVSNAISMSPNAIFLVVSNPVDILSWMTYKLANIESNRVIGTGTVLDSARLRHRLSEELNLDPRNVHAYVIGEHGDSEFIHWSSAFVGAHTLDNYLNNQGKKLQDLKEPIAEEVRQAASKIISNKGYTNYGIAMSVKRICEAIVRDEKSILSISSYDPQQDIYYSIPAIVGKGGKVGHIKPNFNKEEQEKLNSTIALFKSFTKKIKI